MTSLLIVDVELTLSKPSKEIVEEYIIVVHVCVIELL